jgi:ATP/maltotriose-dependent transcriptional regulator MalT
MGESAQLVVPTGRRHIIERPRLTRLLDQTSARVIMLVAPAGYGKTTLARQWLEKRTHGWYAASAASADVAALGTGITDAARSVSNDLGDQFREWLLTRRGDEDAVLAASFLAEDLSRWPEGAWLAIDDYHWFTPQAERVLEFLVDEVRSLRILLTSRRRPVWATSRKLLYGEIYEIARAALAMDQDEANEVLERMDRPAARGLLALADGWPAIIGLASFAEASAFLDRERVPAALLDYVADELYSSLRPSAQEPLCQISLLPAPSAELVERLLEEASKEALNEGFRVGFLTAEDSETFSLHPLLRVFLHRKLGETPKSQRDGLVTKAAALLIDQRSWEGAFDLISEFSLPHLLELLLRSSLYELLNDGRLTTVSKFVAFAQTNSLDSPVFDLASAELAFRQGFHDRARVLSERAGELLEEDANLASKAFCRAGQSAYFSDDPRVAIEYFKRSRQIARDRSDERAAIWGHFIAAVELEDAEAIDLLHQFRDVSGTKADDLARNENGRLHLAMRLGELSEAFGGSEAIAKLVPEAKDPVVRASFWHVYAAALRVAARYPAAIRAADQALLEVDRFHLEFARAHVLLTLAGIRLGLGHPVEAMPLLDEVARLAEDRGDVYLSMNERTARCRLHLLAGDPISGVSVTEGTWPHVPSDGQYSELLACRAIALSRSGTAFRDALELVKEAEQISHENEASHLCMWARAILAMEQNPQSAPQLVRDGLDRSVSTGILDPFVFARRVAPALEAFCEASPLVDELLSRTRAPLGSMASTDAEAIPSLLDQLTRRETEVLALLAESKTNKEIAAALFLSEATVKVHVRHILRKLGARTRTEAAVQAVRMRQLRGLADRTRG